MDKKNMNLKVAMTLALAILTSWQEDDRRNPEKKITRAWKGYLFEVMDELEQRGFIRAAHGTRSMQITEAGSEIGQDLMAHLVRAFAEWIAK